MFIIFITLYAKIAFITNQLSNNNVSGENASSKDAYYGILVSRF